MHGIVLDGVFAQDPYPLYARLRREAPVTQATTATGTPVWLVTRYEDARTALADPRLAKDAHRLRAMLEARGNPRTLDESLMAHMLNSDPPDHTRLRRLVGKAFTARRVEALRPSIERISASLLDRIDPTSEVDLISAYAFPLPITVICALLGIPDADHDSFRSWSNTIVTNSETEEFQIASAGLVNYLTEQIERKRREPGDDMFSALVTARDDGDQLSEEELLAMVFLLLVAGHETTVNLVANGVWSLLRHPDQMARLRGDLGLLPNAVEEFLRFESPVNVATFRFTSEPVRIGDVEIPEGEIVMVSLGSGNRDGDRFPDPDQLDIDRGLGGHLAFGHGIHYCLGAPLARLEAEIAFRDLLTRFDRIELVDEELEWRNSQLMRGLVQLPLRLTPAVVDVA
ncbi:cytochrome P450 family protein [Streptoalloteichus hindustanus]|uniref:Cytochrome P450 n=1 Tax=Streptoalloteichus hindustanus TaxID=2017 RepID=A0A1M5ASE2_STRHI|nr:cytochrome P450 [Streptoalloteichus hindustanus]SHF33151.1 Cytochrome P450 [Streptoalloteichus hindustanus]